MLKDRERLDANIETIRDYTNAHRDLQKSHHFLYDLPLNKYAGTPEIVVMGINPGETVKDRESPGPTEETWLIDFHEGKRTKANLRWREHANRFAGGRPVVFTELLFWSTSDQAELRSRFNGLWGSELLKFCTKMNRSLLELYQPKCVIFVGIGESVRVAQEFGLRRVATPTMHGRHRLVEHYADDHRPWFFTKHWSGSFGFSDKQKATIQAYIQTHT